MICNRLIGLKCQASIVQSILSLSQSIVTLFLYLSLSLTSQSICRRMCRVWRIRTGRNPAHPANLIERLLASRLQLLGRQSSIIYMQFLLICRQRRRLTALDLLLTLPMAQTTIIVLPSGMELIAVIINLIDGAYGWLILALIQGHCV